jgi:hypothetical protein
LYISIAGKKCNRPIHKLVVVVSAENDGALLWDIVKSKHGDTFKKLMHDKFHETSAKHIESAPVYLRFFRHILHLKTMFGLRTLGFVLLGLEVHNID